MILAAFHLADPEGRQVLADLEDPSCELRIGGKPERGESDPNSAYLEIPWGTGGTGDDRYVNRNHSVARREGTFIILERLPPMPGRVAPNPFYSLGPPENRAKLEGPVMLESGQGVVIGSKGQTALCCAHDREFIPELARRIRLLTQQDPGSGFTAIAAPEADYASATLDEYSLRRQLKLLQEQLPQELLTPWADETDLLSRICRLIRMALANHREVSACVVAATPHGNPPEVLSGDGATRTDFVPSRTLLQAAQADFAKEFVWQRSRSAHTMQVSTLHQHTDWVIIVPLHEIGGTSVLRDSHGRPLFMYLESRAASGSPDALVPFLRLMAALLSSLLSLREKQKTQDLLAQFFSPRLREWLGGGMEKALGLTYAECTVLFCDRRGSSRAAEGQVDEEELRRSLESNQEILETVVEVIFEFGGVVADFAGDSVLAFWGWPGGDQANDHARLAVAAATKIAARLGPLVAVDVDSQAKIAPCRLGLSTGRVVVGRIGPRQQLKLGVYGNVVNFGSRLETLGKHFLVPVLMSEATAQAAIEAGSLVRKICYVKPDGFDRAYPVFELVLPQDLGGSGAGSDSIAAYEQALEEFRQRNWVGCLKRLAPLVALDDPPAQWLSMQAASFRAKPPPPGWQGAVENLGK